MAEIYDVVDEQDRVIGRASRKECHQKQLIHRIVHILILRSDGMLVLQKRSPRMDTYPNCITSSAAGHVAAGETYANAATRELEEELGLLARLQEVGFVRSYTPEHMVNVMTFTGASDGPFRPSAEAAELVFLKPKEIEKQIAKNPGRFTPAFRAAFAAFQRR